MKRICLIGEIIIVSICLVLFSCKKSYKIAFIDANGIEHETEEIKEFNDTAAYIEAYKKFLITLKVEKEMKEKFGDEAKTKKFRLYNDKKEDITGIDFTTKEEKEEEERKLLSSIGNVFGSSEIQKIERDSAIIKELSPYFEIKKDEFDVQGRTWYYPKGAPKFINREGIYFYFEDKEGIAKNLRLKIQYYGNDWLFIEKYIFNIDGFPIEFIPQEVERDNNNKVWEWCDEGMTAFEASLIDAIRYGKEIKMKYVGRQYGKVRVLSHKEITAMKRSIEMYEAMGGKIK